LIEQIYTVGVDKSNNHATACVTLWPWSLTL